MQADGTILIDTKINSDGIEAGSKEIEAAVRRMANSVDGLGEKARIALQKQVDSFSKLNNEYSKQAKKVDELKQKVAEYSKQKIPTQEYAEVQQQITAAQKRLDALIDKQRKFLELGGKSNSKAYKSMQYDIDELTNTIKYANGELKDLEQTGKAFTYGVNTDAARQDMEKLAQAEAKLKDMNNRLRTSYQSLEQKVNSYRDELVKTDSAQKKASKSSNGFGKSTKRAGMSMGKMLGMSILFSMVFQAISAVMNGIKEGMNNLAQYSGETNATLSGLMSSLTQLKNAFATAFSPILTAIAPALNYLIGLLTSAATAVAQLVSVLNGKDTFVKAKKVQEDYAASLKDTGSAASKAGKDAEKMLAPFDDLVQIQKPSAAESGGGGGAAGETNPGDMFETVPVDNSLTEAIDAIKKKLLDLKKIFKGGFFDGIGDLSVLESLKNSIISIGDTMREIFTDPQVTDGFGSMIESLIYDLGRITGSFASVGLTIADNLLGGIDLFLKQNKPRIVSDIVSLFDISASLGTIIANFTVAAAQIFAVFRSDTAKQLTADLINIFYTAFTGVLELAGKFGRDVISAVTVPIVQNVGEIRTAIENTLSPIQEVLHTIADSFTLAFETINAVYDEHIKPLFDSFTEGMSEIIGSLLDGYNTYIAPVMDELARKFTHVWKETIDPLIQNFVGAFGDLADLVKAVWENIFQPLINWIAQNIMPVVAPILDALGNYFLTIFSWIGEILNGFLEVLRGVIQFLTGVFTADWQKAWEGIKGIFKGIWDLMPDFVKGPIRSIIGFVNKMIEAVESGINWVIDALNKIHFEVPDWVPGIGGEEFGFNLDSVDLPRIPQLATGTVIPPRAGEFAAILGDNNREAEVVSPVSAIKQALLEAMQESGGTGSQTITIRFEGSIASLARALKPELDREAVRKGTNLVIVGGR